jgi:hypothetical protein
MINRFDFIFSYWIFAWFILYELKITKYNPKIALIIGFICNIIELIAMIYFSNSFIYIFTFCFVNFFIKVLPLFILRNTGYTFVDIYATITLFFIYTFWLTINNINLVKMATTGYDEIKHNKPTAPFMYYASQFFSK